MKRIIKQILLVLVLILFSGSMMLLNACCKKKKPIEATVPETKLVQPVTDTDGDGLKPGSIEGEEQ